MNWWNYEVWYTTLSKQLSTWSIMIHSWSQLHELDMIWTALIKQHDVVQEQQAISRNSVVSEQQRFLKTQAKYKKTWKHVIWK